MIDLIPATTDRGTGLVLPLAKGISHLLTVFNAYSREWTMTVEQAAAELREATEHFSDITYYRELLTDETHAALEAWKTACRAESETYTREGVENPEQSLQDYAGESLRNLALQAWTILTTIDRELTGLADNATDPGRLP